MPTMTNRPRLTSAQFLGAHRRALETVSDLYAAIEEMPILAASDPTTMKLFFDELADVHATAAKLAQHFRTQVCAEEKNSNSFRIRLDAVQTAWLMCVNAKTIHQPNNGDQKMTQHDLDLTITKISNRNRGAGGSWVQGKINDEYRFDALVFAEHAEHESYELNQSKISKLWVQRLADRKVMFNFDRGLDVPAVNTEVQVIVDFLCEGLSDLVFGQ